MSRAQKTLALVVPILGAWSLLLDTQFVRHRALAGPISIARALWQGVMDGSLVDDTLATVTRAVGGLLIGAAAGTMLGLLLGTMRERTAPAESALDFARAIPPALMLPVFLLAFGYGDLTRVGIVAWTSTLVLSMHVAASVRQTPIARLRIFRSFHASRFQTLRLLYWHQATPAMLTGLRQGISLSLIVAVVTEMLIGAPHGLGLRAVSAQVAYEAPGLYAVILVVGSLGYLSSKILLGVESRHARRGA
ncbi:MAG: ABC transporter permease subunit [Sandaracinaceae bacterium]|nr:ABC transporter permease subunit [Sandaracinaceae bacterium]